MRNLASQIASVPDAIAHEELRATPQLKSDGLIHGIDATVNSDVRKLGGEIYLSRARMMRTLETGGRLRNEDLAWYMTHFRSLSHDIQRATHRLPDSVLADSLEMERLTRAWFNYVSRPREPVQSALIRATENYFTELNTVYRRINAATVLAHLPGAVALELSLIDFDTDFSGPADEIYSQLEELQQGLLIDPSRHEPQEGLRRAVTAREFVDSTQYRQSKIYACMKGGLITGYMLAIYNPDSVRHLLGERYDELCGCGVLNPGQRTGWIFTEAVARKGRVEQARNGIHLARELALIMQHDAGREGLDLLLAQVREGENANTAIYSHERHGWRKTTHFALASDGATPLRTIRMTIRPELSAGGPAAHPELGYNSHFETWDTSLALNDSRLDTPLATMSCSQAVDRCREFFEQANWRPIKIRSTNGDKFLIAISERSHEHYLRQERANVDYWCFVNNPPGGRRDRGTLDEILPHVYYAMGGRGRDVLARR